MLHKILMAISPPDTLPKYLANGLPKQDRETLGDARAYIDTLLEERDRSIEGDELPDDATVVERDPDGGGTIVTERVKCGADCTCNDGNGHGPYRYRYVRQGGKLKSEYLGKA